MQDNNSNVNTAIMYHCTPVSNNRRYDSYRPGLSPNEGEQTEYQAANECYHVTFFCAVSSFIGWQLLLLQHVRRIPTGNSIGTNR